MTQFSRPAIDYTVQYLIGHDWHRVDAVYGTAEEALQHGKDLLEMGKVVRILRRDDADSPLWYTLKLDDLGRFASDVPVHSCPR